MDHVLKVFKSVGMVAVGGSLIISLLDQDCLEVNQDQDTWMPLAEFID